MGQGWRGRESRMEAQSWIYKGRYLAGGGLDVGGHKYKVNSGGGAQVGVVGGELAEGNEIRDSKDLVKEWGREDS